MLAGTIVKHVLLFWMVLYYLNNVIKLLLHMGPPVCGFMKLLAGL
jgi:hypothetical protein